MNFSGAGNGMLSVRKPLIPRRGKTEGTKPSTVQRAEQGEPLQVLESFPLCRSVHSENQALNGCFMHKLYYQAVLDVKWKCGLGSPPPTPLCRTQKGPSGGLFTVAGPFLSAQGDVCKISYGLLSSPTLAFKAWKENPLRAWAKKSTSRWLHFGSPRAPVVKATQSLGITTSEWIHQGPHSLETTWDQQKGEETGYCHRVKSGLWGGVLGSLGWVLGSPGRVMGKGAHRWLLSLPCSGNQVHQPGVAHVPMLVAVPGAPAAVWTALVAPPMGDPMSLDGLLDLPTKAHSSLWSVEPRCGLSLKAVFLVELRQRFLPRCMPYTQCVHNDNH